MQTLQSVKLIDQSCSQLRAGLDFFIISGDLEWLILVVGWWDPDELVARYGISGEPGSRMESDELSPLMLESSHSK